MKTETSGTATLDLPPTHRERAGAIIKAHPEVRQLISRNPYSFLILVGVVALQLTLAYVAGGLPWWGVLLMAWFVGAFANHCMYVMIHEATHDRIFVHRWANMLAGIMADIPNVAPAFVSFRTYHLRHHTDMSDYDYDADVPNHWETRLVGNGMLRKALTAAEELSANGIDAEVIDLRVLRPLDEATILASVARTHRAVVIDEGWRSGGIGAEVSARIMEGAFYDLDAPVARVASEEVPMPYAAHLEQAALPQIEDIVDAARALVLGQAAETPAGATDV